MRFFWPKDYREDRYSRTALSDPREPGFALYFEDLARYSLGPKAHSRSNLVLLTDRGGVPSEGTVTRVLTLGGRYAAYE
jgi:hypothetical protein